MMEASQLMKYDQIQKQGSTTVMHTYLVLMTLDTIPAIVSVAGRKKQVQDLKNQVGPALFKISNKRSHLSKTVVARVNDLGEGKAFERVDFEALKKAKDAAEAAQEAVPIQDLSASASDAVSTDATLL